MYFVLFYMEKKRKIKKKKNMISFNWTLKSFKSFIRFGTRNIELLRVLSRLDLEDIFV